MKIALYCCLLSIAHLWDVSGVAMMQRFLAAHIGTHNLDILEEGMHAYERSKTFLYYSK